MADIEADMLELSTQLYHSYIETATDSIVFFDTEASQSQHQHRREEEHRRKVH